MKLNNKGFTLVELMMTLVILAIIIAIASPFVIEALGNSKQGSYDIVVSNILIASKSYYEECKYSSNEKIGCNNMDRTNKTISATLQNLIDYGFLTNSETDCVKVDGIEKCETSNVIKNPKDQVDIGECIVIIKETKTAEGRVEYVVTAGSNTNASCPAELGSIS